MAYEIGLKKYGLNRQYVCVNFSCHGCSLYGENDCTEVRAAKRLSEKMYSDGDSAIFRHIVNTVAGA